jgi:uncharacterized protein YegJ (DUF2314 family)
MRLFLFIFFLAGLTFESPAQSPKNDAPLAVNAPEDKVKPIFSNQQQHLDSLVAPYVQRARATFTGAKERFLKGLKPGESFFVVTRVFDSNGKFEQVFIRVKECSGEMISGTIANHLNTVKEYSYRQLISFNEKDVMDWLIAKPDGSEEGNFVGKFMDTQH